VIVALVGQKGGVGKSTLATSLAVAALERGQAVLLVDADPQGTARTWGDVAAEAGHPAPTVVAMGATMHKPGQLPQVAPGYDLVVIDGPPRHGEIQRAALMVADLAVLPCGPSAADAWALTASLDLLAAARAVRPALRAGVVITRKQGHTALGKGARAALTASGLPVLAAELGYRVAYQEALGAGQGVTTYAPRDPAAAEVRALLEDLTALAAGRDRSHGQEAARRRAPPAARAR